MRVRASVSLHPRFAVSYSQGLQGPCLTLSRTRTHTHAGRRSAAPLLPPSPTPVSAGAVFVFSGFCQSPPAPVLAPPARLPAPPAGLVVLLYPDCGCGVTGPCRPRQMFSVCNCRGRHVRAPPEHVGPVAKREEKKKGEKKRVGRFASRSEVKFLLSCFCWQRRVTETLPSLTVFVFRSARSVKFYITTSHCPSIPVLPLLPLWIL